MADLIVAQLAMIMHSLLLKCSVVHATVPGDVPSGAQRIYYKKLYP